MATATLLCHTHWYQKPVFLTKNIVTVQWVWSFMGRNAHGTHWFTPAIGLTVGRVGALVRAPTQQLSHPTCYFRVVFVQKNTNFKKRGAAMLRIVGKTKRGKIVNGCNDYCGAFMLHLFAFMAVNLHYCYNAHQIPTACGKQTLRRVRSFHC